MERGGTWVSTGFRRYTNTLLNDPRRPGLLFAGTGDGVWLSPDGGATWRRAGAGLDGTAILALAAPATGRTIVAGGQDGGVYVGAARPEG